MIHSTVVNAGADSTTIIVQQINSTTHRVFLIGGSSVSVYCGGGSTNYPISSLGLNNKGMYRDFSSSCPTPATARNVDDGNNSVLSPIEEFVCNATKLAFASGMSQSQAPGWPIPSTCSASCSP
jgi:hypothetical protein